MNALANLAVWWSRPATVVSVVILIIFLGIIRHLLPRALWSVRRRPCYALVLFILIVIVILALLLTGPWWW